MQSLRSRARFARPLSSGAERGSTNWAFIITLILLLVFIYLWYDEADQQDKLNQDLADAQQRNRDLNAEADRLATWAQEVTDVVGWNSRPFRLQHVSRANKDLVLTDPAIVRQHFSPDGQVPGPEEGQTVPGIVNRLLSAATLTFEREARLHTQTTAEEKPHTFETLSSEFKEKLESVRQKWDGVALDRPAPPADPDDAQAQADYAAALEEWERRVAEYHQDYEELAAMEGWTEFTERIAPPGEIGDPSKEGVTLQFYSYTDSGETTVEAAMVGLPEAFRLMAKELEANMEVWGQQVTQLRSDLVAKETAVTECQQALAAEQEARTRDVNQITTRLNAETERANRNAIEKTQAENDLAKVRQDTTDTVKELNRELEARKEQNRLLKEKRDLVIARNDTDGKVLVANGVLGTAMIDLGHKDKVFVGQKFGVSDLDRMGNRRMKGEIMIVRVTGDHSAKARILAGDVSGGDNIHNPFYQPGETIYVYFAGKLDKWPRAMAEQRLARMGVVLQDAPNGKTHYIVVPNSWSVDAPAGGAEDDMGEDEGAGGATPLEETLKTARIFGANVITENVLDAFLDY